MLQTVEAEIGVNGKVKLLEPVNVTRKSRAIVTLMIDESGAAINENESKKILESLRSPEFANRKSYSVEEIEAQIEKARNSFR